MNSAGPAQLPNPYPYMTENFPLHPEPPYPLMKPSTERQKTRWEQPDPTPTGFRKFCRLVNQKRNKNLQTSADVYAYSVEELSNFYEDILCEFGVIYEGRCTHVVDETARMDSIPDWFPGIKLNYAENALFTRSPLNPSHRTTSYREDSNPALICLREGGAERSTVTYGQLRSHVGRVSQALRAHGVKKGDRVAGVVSNSVEALYIFLSTVALGAIYSCTSTDMGVKGILERLVQIEPVWVFMDDAAVYNGKTIDLREKMKGIVGGLDGVKGFRGMVALSRFPHRPADVKSVPRTTTLEDFLEGAESDELVVERVPFRHPFFIAYTSGTTGRPKCIVHCGGGIALTAKREALFHTGFDQDSICLQYTNTGWIMYLAQLDILQVGGQCVLYDGSPFRPTPETWIRLIGDLKVTHLGTSPRYLYELRRLGISPREICDLSSLKRVTCGGMILSSALFDWFYDKGFPMHVRLCNAMGSTDTACGVAVDNLAPVVSPECQGRATGHAVEIYEPVESLDHPVKGRRVIDGESGEMVITKPFPTMPVTFWGPNGRSEYISTYFSKYDDAWSQGDVAQINTLTGSVTLIGRSDTVLNPSGIRFGPADIYSILEKEFSGAVADSIVVGQRRKRDEDEQVVLFLLLKPHVNFTRELVREVKNAIAKGLSKRHVPKYVFETIGIPVTTNGKKMEVIVKRILSGERARPSAAVSNGECLGFYEAYVEIEQRWKGVERQWGTARL